MQYIDFTRKFPKERRIGDYGRLTTAWMQEVEQRMEQLPRKYFLWNQEASEIKHNLWKIRAKDRGKLNFLPSSFLEKEMRFSLLIIGFFAVTLTFASESDDSTEKYFPQKLTAQGLLYYCASSALTSSGRNRRNYCSGFVSGVEESFRLIDSVGNKKVICVPAGKQASHFRGVYIKHASKKSTNLERPAAMVVLEALESAYPCGK